MYVKDMYYFLAIPLNLKQILIFFLYLGLVLAFGILYMCCVNAPCYSVFEIKAILEI